MIDEYIKRVVSNADSCCDGNKIKTHFAQIIVHGKAEKPYYEILYFDTEDRTYHIGFGSYCLDYVFEWLSNEFEIVEAEQEAEVAPVRHGRWIEPSRLYYGAKQYECSLCYSDTFWKKHSITEKYPHCPNCGATMELED